MFDGMGQNSLLLSESSTVKEYDGAKMLYEEDIYSRWNIVILGAVSLSLLGDLVYQLLVSPVGTRPAPDWFFLVIFLFFLALGVNFARLRIRVTPESITVGYGIIKHRVSWQYIADCYLDKASAIIYGGWGIRVGRVGGKWRLVYNILGGPRVVLSLKTGIFREFVFSTRNPEGVIQAIRQYLSKAA